MSNIKEISNPLLPDYRIKQLFQDVQINPQYPLIRYFRSGPEMISMARIYEREEDLERAFILYYKYITLFIEKLPSIPQYKEIPIYEKISVRNVLKEILPKAEILKNRIHKKYENEYRNFLEHQNHIEKEIEKSNSNLTCIPEKGMLDKNLSHFPNFPVPSRDLKPKNMISNSPTINGSYNIDPIYNTNSPGQLRMVKLPKNLVPIFLSLAEYNTDKNVETGGHLFGKLGNNIFTVTHLVIPKQSGKSDSFLAINEEEMVYFKESKNLLTLGWIHTHPSQTAFLSSVDLHNQYPNQQLLSEYIAIVCAPSHKETKCFTITPDYGMNVLAACKEEGFHYHPQNPPLYEECKHVSIEPNLDVVVEDMRYI